MLLQIKETPAAKQAKRPDHETETLSVLVKSCSAFNIAHGQYPINWEAAHLTELWVVDIYKKIVNYRGILFAHSATSEACGLTTVIIFGYKEIYIPRDYFRQFIPSLPQQQVQVQPPLTNFGGELYK